MAVNHTTIEAGALSESSGKSQLYLILAILLGVLYLASKLWNSSTPDSREPALIHPKIPIIGHAIGMMMHQAEYLSTLWYVQCRVEIHYGADTRNSDRNNLPIFMIKIFGGQLYIINSPELTQAVFRHSKAFSFDPISTSGSKRLFQMTDRQMKVLAKPIPGIKDVEFPLNAQTFKAMCVR